MFDQLKRWINNKIDESILIIYLTSSTYGNPKNNVFKNILRFIPKVASVFVILFFFFPSFTSLNPVIGIYLSVIVFLFLTAEFLSFRPRIFDILALSTTQEIHKALQSKFPAVAMVLSSSTTITRWKTFYKTKKNAASCLKDDLISSDRLRFHCIANIFFRVLVLLSWYSVIIMYADIASGGEILCHHSECFAHLSECITHSFADYLYQEFSLFLSISSISILTSTIGGILILLGQIMIYFIILIVVIGRISDYVSMYSNQIENVAHNIVIECLEV